MYNSNFKKNKSYYMNFKHTNTSVMPFITYISSGYPIYIMIQEISSRLLSKNPKKIWATFSRSMRTRRSTSRTCGRPWPSSPCPPGRKPGTRSAKWWRSGFLILIIFFYFFRFRKNLSHKCYVQRSQNVPSKFIDWIIFRLGFWNTLC